jgi:hypothetical protein
MDVRVGNKPRQACRFDLRFVQHGAYHSHMRPDNLARPPRRAISSPGTGLAEADVPAECPGGSAGANTAAL